MKKQTLIEAMDAAMLAVSSSPVLEEYADVRIRGYQLRTCNGQTMVQVTLDEDTGVDCRVNARKFHKLLTSLPADEISLDLKGDVLHVDGGKRTKAKYQVIREGGHLDELDFEIDRWDEVPEGLLQGLRMCRFACSRDKSRGTLTGVAVEGDKVTASDSFRIARYGLDGGTTNELLVLPSQDVDRLVRNADKITAWSVQGDALYWKLGNGAILAFRCMPGDYPDTDKFLSRGDSLGHEFVFPEGTKESLRRHREQQDNVARLDQEVTVRIGEDKLTISSTDRALYQLDETFEVEAGEGMEFKIHPEFLADILGRTQTMAYDPEMSFIQFSEGSFTYLAGVERT